MCLSSDNAQQVATFRERIDQLLLAQGNQVMAASDGSVDHERQTQVDPRGVARSGPRKRLLHIALASAIAYAAVGLGVAWGLVEAQHRFGLEGQWLGAGSLAVLMVGIDWLRYLASRRLRAAAPVIHWICLALGLYMLWLMYVDAFLWYSDDASFVRGVLLLVPFLLAMGPLTRVNAWLAVLGSSLFLATCLAMLIRNGCSLRGGSGFFGGWVT